MFLMCTYSKQNDISFCTMPSKIINKNISSDKKQWLSVYLARTDQGFPLSSSAREINIQNLKLTKSVRSVTITKRKILLKRNSEPVLKQNSTEISLSENQSEKSARKCYSPFVRSVRVRNSLPEQVVLAPNLQLFQSLALPEIRTLSPPAHLKRHWLLAATLS